MTCANTDKKRISSWPAAGSEFLISAIISMTFFPVVRSNPRRRELLCICEGAIRLTNLSGKKKKKKDKPIFTKHSLDSCVISQDLYAEQQRERRARGDLFFFKSCKRTFHFVSVIGGNYFLPFGTFCVEYIGGTNLEEPLEKAVPEQNWIFS